MKSILPFLSLAVFIGTVCCMSLQEYEDDEDATNSDLGWGHFHIHVHFHHHLLTNDEDVKRCKGKACLLCKNTDYNVVINSKLENANAKFNYKGCFAITKDKDAYAVEFLMDGKKLYKNIYEMNSKTVLPCIHDEKMPKDLEICPVLYNVNLEKREFCANIYDNLEFQNTALKHKLNIGCVTVPEEMLLE